MLRSDTDIDVGITGDLEVEGSGRLKLDISNVTSSIIAGRVTRSVRALAAAASRFLLGLVVHGGNFLGVLNGGKER